MKSTRRSSVMQNVTQRSRNPCICADLNQYRPLVPFGFVGRRRGPPPPCHAHGVDGADEPAVRVPDGEQRGMRGRAGGKVTGNQPELAVSERVSRPSTRRLRGTPRCVGGRRSLHGQLLASGIQCTDQILAATSMTGRKRSASQHNPPQRSVTAHAGLAARP